MYIYILICKEEQYILNGLTVAICAVIGVLVCFSFLLHRNVFQDKHFTFVEKNIMGKTFKIVNQLIKAMWHLINSCQNFKEK